MIIAMRDILTTLAGLAIAVALGLRLALSFRAAAAKRRSAPGRLYARAGSVLSDMCYEGVPAIGYPALLGTSGDLPVRLQAVVDTLAIRKLPALWLMVTVPVPLPVRATFDLMMRPAGPTTFSNFDHLPDIIGRPPGFPEQGIVRSDDAAHAPPAHLVAPHVDLFHDGRAKELLITPKGLRIVWQLAEADRVRYGIFRQAEFGDAVIDADVLHDLVVRLKKLRTAIIEWAAANQ